MNLGIHAYLSGIQQPIYVNKCITLLREMDLSSHSDKQSITVIVVEDLSCTVEGAILIWEVTHIVDLLASVCTTARMVVIENLFFSIYTM